MSLRITLCGVLWAASFLLPASQGHAFCGFYVAKADTELFNRASKVAMVRDGERTVITMVNDYRGEPKAFALVVPVPDVLTREQIRVTDATVVEHLDAYTAPRLVEYFDPDPCRPLYLESMAKQSADRAAATGLGDGGQSLGVTIEASYQVGEYEILILSAAESGGLETWLRQNGYRVPAGVAAVLGDYIAAGMKFFVAKVNLAEQARLGFGFLRPLQIAFKSPDFMLPIRLGMVNADGPQELFVFALTRTGRVETSNYRTVRMPSDIDVPIFVREDFARFYSALFHQQLAREGGRAVFLEYAWDMAWCDPCAADPLTVAELRQLGVFWLPDVNVIKGGQTSKSQARNVYVTRLHLRYDARTFPHDLVFTETGDRRNFQGRYILRHPWRGQPRCPAAKNYLRSLPGRFEKEAQQAATLTGWPIEEIRSRMERNGQPFDLPSEDYPRWPLEPYPRPED